MDSLEATHIYLWSAWSRINAQLDPPRGAEQPRMLGLMIVANSD